MHFLTWTVFLIHAAIALNMQGKLVEVYVWSKNGKLNRMYYEHGKAVERTILGYVWSATLSILTMIVLSQLVAY